MAFLDKSRRRHRNLSLALFAGIPLLVLSVVGVVTWMQVRNYNLAREEKRQDELRQIAYEQREKQEDALAKQYAILVDILDDYYEGKIVDYPEPVVGQIKLQRHPDGRITFFDDWVEKNIINVDVPELREIGRPVNSPIVFNRRAAADLQAAFREIKARGLLDRVLTWDRDFVAPDSPLILNLISGTGGGPSPHVLGIGFDINSSYNKRDQPATPKGQTGSVIELVPIFREFGFGWGGEKDGRHFEYIRPDASFAESPAKE